MQLNHHVKLQSCHSIDPDGRGLLGFGPSGHSMVGANFVIDVVEVETTNTAGLTSTRLDRRSSLPGGPPRHT